MDIGAITELSGHGFGSLSELQYGQTTDCKLPSLGLQVSMILARNRFSPTIACYLCLFVLPSVLAAGEALVLGLSAATSHEVDVTVPGFTGQAVRLYLNQAVQIRVGLSAPSQLPDNARVRVTWSLDHADNPQHVPRAPTAAAAARAIDAFGIYTAPTPNWSKILHALDPDVYLIYRAPVAGVYRLTVHPEQDAVDLFAGSRWRESGNVAQLVPSHDVVRWDQSERVKATIAIEPLDLEAGPDESLQVESEPNDTPEQAQSIPLRDTNDDYSLHVVGGSDDVEYFDNGRVGSSGDDWFRLEYAGSEGKLLTACLSIPDQQVAARIRCYRVDLEKGPRVAPPGELLAISEYTDGKNPNERTHQQEEQHRIAINRLLNPGEIYLLRVEANAPGYELELRIVTPAPFDDPRQAVRHGLYDHLGQVTAWLMNRPRGASVERRIRDSGNLLGTNCMSCHTQSGVWGPAMPLANGYRPQNVQLWRQLINICYQSMRPTNKLVDAANNTSLAPLDLGDGPAGTRVAGYAVVTLEQYRPARRLQSKQAIRAANFVLQSGDPGGINAAGPGANVGQGVVFNYAGEILWSAWRATSDPKYFRGLEDKARKMLDIDVIYTDDLGHRVQFFQEFFPRDYVTVVREVAVREKLDDQQQDKMILEAEALDHRIRDQVAVDLERIRALQSTDGAWGFDPGNKEVELDPSPTATSLIALHAAGVPVDDPTVAKGIRALLRMQHPTGYWNRASKTGFVSTSYAMHALSRYFPEDPVKHVAKQFEDWRTGSLRETIRRARELSVSEHGNLAGLMIESAAHSSPLVRYWAMIGLGSIHTDAGATALVRGLGDPVKMVREAAQWGLRQTLIDDRGWDQLLAVVERGDDRSRESAMRAMQMRVDGVLPKVSIEWKQLTNTLSAAMNDDPHPAVRAWAARAAWNWWIWNPPTRSSINKAWIRLMERDEPNVLVENAIRYQSHALFIANGHVANASEDHQYAELADLFRGLFAKVEEGGEHEAELQQNVIRRLMAISATFYNQRGGDGGPGQMGYVTPGSVELFGTAILSHLARVESLAHSDRRDELLRITLEGAANIPLESLQERLVDYSINGPEKFRSLAAAGISDSRLVTLVAVAEQLEPMYAQLVRGANEPPRRTMLSDPILQMFRSVRWNVPSSRQQRDDILAYLMPDFAEYHSPQQLDEMDEVSVRREAERASEATWYLSEGLGDVVAGNDDLHFDAMAEAVPENFANASAVRFWLRNIPWVLTFKTELPVVKSDGDTLPPLDPHEELRSRALRLFLGQLAPEADERNRRLAIELGNNTVLRRNPEVLAALARVAEFESDEKVRETINKVLSQERETFHKSLIATVAKSENQPFPVDDNGQPELPADFIEDVNYFRDYVIPEMIRVLRTDQRSCLICHGEPGRVPSMELHRPDDVGYLPVDQLLANYRILQERIDLTDVDRSKLLRKPLNVQSGEEDGHQGGRRYQPDDPGYQIIRRWVGNQVELQQKYRWPRDPVSE